MLFQERNFCCNFLYLLSIAKNYLMKFFIKGDRIRDLFTIISSSLEGIPLILFTCYGHLEDKLRFGLWSNWNSLRVSIFTLLKWLVKNHSILKVNQSWFNRHINYVMYFSVKFISPYIIILHVHYNQGCALLMNVCIVAITLSVLSKTKHLNYQ